MVLFLPGNVLKINQFLNHQIDPQLMYEIGQEFERLFKGEAVTKILTVEASGIAPAIMAGLVMDVQWSLRERKSLRPWIVMSMRLRSIHTLKSDQYDLS